MKVTKSTFFEDCSEPLVSIVVPVYNAESYIEKNIEAILQQTYQNIEIIAIVDGSQDNSYQLMQALALNDARLQVFCQVNHGAGYARNIGLEKAKGNYIVFWDVDDNFAPNAIEKVVHQAQSLASDIVVYKAKTYDCSTGRSALLNDGLDVLEKLGKLSFAPYEIAEDIFNVLLLQVWNKLYRRKFLLENKIVFQNIPMSNDILFTVSALCSATTISIINEILVYYNVDNKNGLHNKYDENPLCFYEALLESKKILYTKKLFFKYEESFQKLAIDVILYNLSVLKTAVARVQVLAKLRQDGLKKLKLDNSQTWAKHGCWLQYLVINYCDSFLLLKISYFLTKVKVYYRNAGLKGLSKKISMYFRQQKG